MADLASVMGGLNTQFLIIFFSGFLIYLVRHHWKQNKENDWFNAIIKSTTYGTLLTILIMIGLNLISNDKFTQQELFLQTTTLSLTIAIAVALAYPIALLAHGFSELIVMQGKITKIKKDKRKNNILIAVVKKSWNEGIGKRITIIAYLIIVILLIIFFIAAIFGGTNVLSAIIIMLFSLIILQKDPKKFEIVSTYSIYIVLFSIMVLIFIAPHITNNSNIITHVEENDQNLELVIRNPFDQQMMIQDINISCRNEKEIQKIDFDQNCNTNKRINANEVIEIICDIKGYKQCEANKPDLK